MRWLLNEPVIAIGSHRGVFPAHPLDTSELEAVADTATQQHVVDPPADSETRCILPIVILIAFTVQPAELAIGNTLC